MNILKKFISFDVLFTILTGSLFVFFMDLYGMHKNYIYLIISIILTGIFLTFIYKMSVEKFEPVIINLSAKVFPMIVLTILSIGFFNKKCDFRTILGLVLIFIGAIIIS